MTARPLDSTNGRDAGQPNRPLIAGQLSGRYHPYSFKCRDLTYRGDDPPWISGELSRNHDYLEKHTKSPRTQRGTPFTRLQFTMIEAGVASGPYLGSIQTI
jgi:hypothetical protein